MGARVSTTVLIANDEFLTRPTIIAWLIHPSTASKRDGARNAMVDWGRWRANLHLVGRKQRVETKLHGLEIDLNLRLLMGEYLRRRMLDDQSKRYRLPTFHENANEYSKKSFWRKLNDAGWNVEERNGRGRLWRDRLPSMNLAMAICALSGWQDTEEMPRPDLETLLFTQRPWALSAVRCAEEFRQEAIHAGLPRAESILEFRVTANF